MIIDFHTHTFPDKIAKTAIPQLEQNASIKAFTDGTVSGLLSSMRRAGINISVILPVVTNPQKADKINALSANINQTYSNIISFGGIHPLTENYRQVLKNAVNMGLKGIKLHPEYQDTDFDDISYMRILDCAEELGLVTVVHAGYDGGFPASRHCFIDNILHVLNRIKPKRLVLAHMGGCMIWDKVREYIAGADVYFDTALSFGKKQLPNLLNANQFIDLSRAHGTDKILFATDSPWGEQQEMSEFVKNSNLTDTEKEDILYKNASRLLKL